MKSEEISPMSGTESDVAGMISATSSMKTVRESSTVMPAQRNSVFDLRATTCNFSTGR